MAKDPKKKENRGGKREGSGRKRTFLAEKRSPESYSASKLQELNDRIEAKAKTEGQHIDDVALDIIYDDEHPIAARMKAYDTIKKYSSIQASEGGDADKNLGPAVYLPEQDKGVELKVVK